MPPKRKVENNVTEETSSSTSSSTYLECKEGTSNKFWSISINDITTTIKYGKIGTNGTESIKEHKDNATANKFAAKQISEKNKKGYTTTISSIPIKEVSKDVGVGNKKKSKVEVEENTKGEKPMWAYVRNLYTFNSH